MTKFSNKYRSFVNKTNDDRQCQQKKLESIALAEVMMYIEENLQSSEKEEFAPYIKISDARKFYCHCLEVLHTSSVNVNATRLKESILRLNPNLEALSSKNEVYLSYKDNLAAALQYSREHSLESEAADISRAAKIIRNDILAKRSEFKGYFADNCQTAPVPESLLSFLNIVIGSYDPVGNDAQSTMNIPALSFLN